MRTVEKVTVIVRKFSEQAEWGVSELARAIDTDKAIVHRILKTLMREQWVQQNGVNRRYILGPALLELGASRVTRSELLYAAEPVVTELARRLDETVMLCGRHENFNVVELIREGTKDVRVVSALGRRIPLHCGAAGKVLVAFDHPSVCERLLASELTMYTPKTITDPDELMKRFAHIRERGWSFEDEEFSTGVSGIAAPVWGNGGRIEASICVRAPSSRLNESKAQRIAPLVVDAAMQISAVLGHRPSAVAG